MKFIVPKTLAWIPVGFAFSDIVASVHQVVGESMCPTFNPAGSTLNDVLLLEHLSFRSVYSLRFRVKPPTILSEEESASV
jgi:signal peptidase I